MKFTIRDILWCTVVVAIGITCCLERDKRRVMTRNWVAAVNEQTRTSESLGNEIRVLNLDLERIKNSNAYLRKEHDRNLRELDQTNQRLAKEIAERIRLSQELERIASRIANRPNQPFIEPTEGQ
jgi:hypothetical protein